jgi:hypothetical protein
MNDITKTQIQGYWVELGECLKGIQLNIAKSGELVCKILDNDPDARDKFRKAGITPGFYSRLEKVGRGVLLPELAQYTRFERFPIDQQRLVLTGEVTAVIEKADGSFDTVKVDVLRASPDVAKLCIAGDHIRTPEEQRRMIERTRKPAVKATDACTVPWRAVGKVIEVIKPCILTRGDLLSALKALEG